MTTTTITSGDVRHAKQGPGAARPSLMSRPLVMVFVSSVGAMTSFYLLLSVVPMFATSVGADGTTAGLATATLMLSTVAAELVTPRLTDRFGYRLVFVIGLLLLGAPALALTASAGMAVTLAVCAVRGVGFGIAVVVSGALVATLVPDERRGEGLGLYGIIVGAPSLAAMPFGVWLVEHVGYQPVFVAGAAVAIISVVVAPGLPDRAPGCEQPVGMVAALRTRTLIGPAGIFAVTAMAAGTIVTFLPLAVGPSAGNVAALALLAQSATTTLSRWWAGRYGDRHGYAVLLVPGIVAVAAGMVGAVLAVSPAAVVIGMMIFGAGFGVSQNATLAMMFDRAPASGYDTVSALWNLAYDLGLGLGAAGFGLVAGRTGYSVAFALTAVLVLTAVVPSRRQRT